MGKAKRKMIVPTNVYQIGTQEIGRRIFIDISSAKIGKGLVQDYVTILVTYYRRGNTGEILKVPEEKG